MAGMVSWLDYENFCSYNIGVIQTTQTTVLQMVFFHYDCPDIMQTETTSHQRMST